METVLAPRIALQYDISCFIWEYIPYSNRTPPSSALSSPEGSHGHSCFHLIFDHYLQRVDYPLNHLAIHHSLESADCQYFVRYRRRSSRYDNLRRFQRQLLIAHLAVYLSSNATLGVNALRQGWQSLPSSPNLFHFTLLEPLARP